MLSPSTMSLAKEPEEAYRVGFTRPTGDFPAANKPALMRASMPATLGADADVHAQDTATPAARGADAATHADGDDDDDSALLAAVMASPPPTRAAPSPGTAAQMQAARDATARRIARSPAVDWRSPRWPPGRGAPAPDAMALGDAAGFDDAGDDD